MQVGARKKNGAERNELFSIETQHYQQQHCHSVHHSGKIEGNHRTDCPQGERKWRVYLMIDRWASSLAFTFPSFLSSSVVPQLRTKWAMTKKGLSIPSLVLLTHPSLSSAC